MCFSSSIFFMFNTHAQFLICFNHQRKRLEPNDSSFDSIWDSLIVDSLIALHFHSSTSIPDALAMSLMSIDWFSICLFCFSSCFCWSSISFCWSSFCFCKISTCVCCFSSKPSTSSRQLWKTIKMCVQQMDCLHPHICNCLPNARETLTT